MKTFLIVLGVIVLLLIGGLIGGYAYVTHIINSPQGTGEAQTFLVTKGEGVREIAEKMAAAGLIRNAEIFQFYLWQQGYVAKIQTGSYQIDPSESMKAIAAKLIGGGVNPDERRVTFIEGLRRDEIAKKIEDAGLGSAAQFLSLTASTIAWNYPFLSSAPSGATLEGFLFPDTYVFSTKNTMQQIIKKMLDNFQTKTAAFQTEAGSSTTQQNFFKVVTLASIVQAEVPHPEMQAMVAGIFYNRLRVGMKLQSNVTVNFALKNREPALSLTDISIDSPYNTYKYAGLTPGPIDNPGLSAISAVLNPTSSDYFFFLTKPDGTPVYSKTAAEHNTAKAKYLK